MCDFPTAGVTGRTGSAAGKVLTNRAADQNTVDGVTALAIIMRLGGGADQGVVVTAGTVGRCNLNQGAVIRGVGGMGRFPTTAMTFDTGTGRDPRQQAWDSGGMTEITITHMGDGHCRIRPDAWIVTGLTGSGAGNMTEGHMINAQVNGQLFVGMTWQTVGRVGT